MTAIIIFSFLLVLYFIIIGILIKRGRVKDNNTIRILPPDINEEIQILPSKNQKTDILLTLPPNNDPYLQMIAEYLLNQKNEPFKIIKFLDIFPDPEEKSFLIDYIKYYDLKLFDTISALSGVDLEDIEEFSSTEVFIENPGFNHETGNPLLTPKEELVYGGIPYELFEEEIQFTDVNSFGEYVDQLYELYISRVLSADELKQINEAANKITRPFQLYPDSSSLQSPVKLFQKGETIAQELQEEIQQQNHV